MRLQGGVGDFAANEALGEDHVGGLQALLHVAEVVVVLLFDVVRLVLVDPVPRRLHGLFGVEPGRERLVVDLDPFQRLPGHLLGFGRHPGHVVAQVAHLVEGERRLVVPDGQDAVLVGEVAPGDHGVDTRQGLRPGGIDLPDARVGMRAMEDFPHQHPGQHQVVRVQGSPGHLVRPVHHGQAPADDGQIRHG